MPTKVSTREAVCPFATVAVAPVNIPHLPKLQRHATTNADTLYLSEQATTSSHSPFHHIALAPSSYHKPATLALATHPSGRMHIHAVFACVALVELFVWLFGIVPFFTSTSQ